MTGRRWVPADHAPVVVAVNVGERDCVRVGPGSIATAGPMMVAGVGRVGRYDVDTLGTPVRDGDCLTEAPDVDEVTTLAHLRLGSPGTRSIAIRPDLATGGRFEILPRP
jgi:hypothetical protein